MSKNFIQLDYPLQKPAVWFRISGLFEIIYSSRSSLELFAEGEPQFASG